MFRCKWLLIGLFSFVTPSLAGAATYVLGDSIGDGLATTMGFNNLAQIGIHIRGPRALEQIERTPPGSTVLIFLGTNDAEGGLANIDKSIDDVLAAAARRNLDVTWIGPHCVRKDWDSQAVKLDGILRAHLAKSHIRYIGMRDPTICSGKFHEPDGIHLTGKGYRYMWSLLQNTIDMPAAQVATAAPARQGGAAADAGDTTGALSAPHRLVMEIHVPGSPSDPLVWTRSQN